MAQCPLFRTLVGTEKFFANLSLYVNVNRSGFCERTSLMCGILVEKLTQL